MRDQTLLYCVGATKAGTSWLYRMLHDHPQCKLRAVKEAHYWDTFGPKVQEAQIAAFRKRIDTFEAQRDEAAIKGNLARAENLQGQIEELEALVAVIGGPRKGDAAYWSWLAQGGEGADVVADMTPAYALVREDKIARMLALRPLVKVIYLVRDPLARLWSHIRMQVTRAGQTDAEMEVAANDVLRKIVDGGDERHILARGDYRAAIEKLRRTVPAGRLMIAFCENMFTPAGWSGICAFLGIADTGLDAAKKVHEGAKARMDEGLAARGVRFLKDQYDWVESNVGPLPQQWQDNLARAHA